MGASHATLSSVDDQDGVDLPNYTVEQRLYPGSGRMMRSFRLKHDKSGALVVAKHFWVSQEHEATVKEQVEELRRIRQALAGQPHVAPFLVWNLGDYVTKSAGSAAFRSVHLLRPHIYTTLSDRLASRPFLAHVEKLWILQQILGALQAMHDAGVVHGFLTTENVGLSSWNFVVLVDVASYKARTTLPDDDPSEYLYYFQELNKQEKETTTLEKRCYLAPERFRTPSRQAFKADPPPLTPAMDIFSAGCIAIETFLNGERALDLGDLMEYRRQKSVVPALQQKLNKIESSSLRAACRHMLHIDPAQRLSAQDYLARLESVMPPTFDTLMLILKRVTCEGLTPDARMAIAAASYGKVLQQTTGTTDVEGEHYFAKMLGPTMCNVEMHPESAQDKSVSGPSVEPNAKSMTNPIEEEDRLLAETEALLARLASLKFDDDDESVESALSLITEHKSADTPTENLPPSASTHPASASSLLVFVQLVLSTVTTVQRPSSKLVGLQLLERCGRFVSDEARLQRIVPTAISLLHDQEALVRAKALEVITSTMASIQAFPPSDSKIFPEYIFKRVAHLITDQSFIVRVVFARNIALLADTAHRFLDISHAVRLYEAVGAGYSTGGSSHGSDGRPTSDVFDDDVAKLLGGPGEGDSTHSGKSQRSLSAGAGQEQSSTLQFGDTLIRSSYTTELSALHETVSRWVVQITTDQSGYSSPTKRSLLCDLTRLCNFFGRDGVMAFILPQILAFLNDRQDWQLRAALFQRLSSVCYIIGRAATEHFVLPCLETALVDSCDQVICSALLCLASLVDMGLLSRSILATPPSVTNLQETQNRDLLKRYMPLLLYPVPSVRQSAIVLVHASMKAFGFPDADVFLLPSLRPYLRFEPTAQNLMTNEGLENCLIPPFTRSELDQRLTSFAKGSTNRSEAGQWTPVAEYRSESNQTGKIDSNEPESDAGGNNRPHLANDYIERYLKLLSRGRAQASQSNENPIRDGLANAIEGPLKMSQSTKFPSLTATETPAMYIPSWYANLREKASFEGHSSESSAIRSVASLGQVYGLSILYPAALQGSDAVEEDPVVVEETDTKSVGEGESIGDDRDLLRSSESKIVQAATLGEWGADTAIDPTLSDTTLLIGKLKGLQVPTLPPNLGKGIISLRSESVRDTSGGNEWKPRVDGLVASSSPLDGHSASVSRLAVSQDQNFFVSGSYDETCRVWESRRIVDSDGILESSLTYTGHSTESASGAPARINDVKVLENSHSVASGASDGSVHVWRVDMVSTKKTPKSVEAGRPTHLPGNEDWRVSGSTLIRNLDRSEGEVLAVDHFNSPSASIITFATQSRIHSWDLRSSKEPFKLDHAPDLGYLTSFAVGTDRHWVVAGTSRGFLSLWDIRFQQIVKLWKHSDGSPIHRLAASVTSLPSIVGEKSSTSDVRPYVHVACGKNESATFDLTLGACRQCFRVTYPGNSRTHPSQLMSDTNRPFLKEVAISSGAFRTVSRFDTFAIGHDRNDGLGPSINSMVYGFGSAFGDRSYLITGGDDCCIRYWDFTVPSKCYTISGMSAQQRPSYERIDCDGRRYMLCRQSHPPRRAEVESSRVPRLLHRGTTRPENKHTDSIQDLKLIDGPMRGLLSCSRDGLVKVWR